MPKRLLLIDPIPTHRIRLKAELRAAQYEVLSVDRIACARSVASAHSIDLVIVNTSGTDPAQMTGRLRKALEGVDAPLLCRDEDAGPERRIQALANGARDMVCTRAPMSLLLARLRALLRDNEAEVELERRRLAAASFGFREASAEFRAEGRIVSVSVGSEVAQNHKLSLTGAHKISYLTCDELLRDGQGGTAPDAILLSVGDNGADILDGVLPEIRTRSHLRQSSVLVLHPKGTYDIAQRALNLGAADAAEDGSMAAEIAHRVETMLARKRVRDALRRSTEESFKLATTDTLTGLFNRRYSEVYLADALVKSVETGSGLTVMMIDVDHFKAVNDTFGHASGDVVLCEVAKRLRDNLRAVDLVSRHGGEEFLVILPDIEGVEAELAADRLRANISERPIAIPNGSPLSITVSIGVACSNHGDSVGPCYPAASGMPKTLALPHTQSVMKTLLLRADEALYAAKDAGRNCISVSRLSASAA